jgi:hypothetical protein
MSEGFHAVEWMRKKRAAVDEEDRGLTWPEKARRTGDLLEQDPLWQRLRGRVVQPAATSKKA